MGRFLTFENDVCLVNQNPFTYRLLAGATTRSGGHMLHRVRHLCLVSASPGLRGLGGLMTGVPTRCHECRNHGRICVPDWTPATELD